MLIKQTPDTSVKFKPRPSLLPALDSKKFIDNLKRLTEEGYLQGYSREFVAKVLADEINHNAKMAKQMGFPQGEQAVLRQIVEPYWTRQDLAQGSCGKGGWETCKALAEPHLEYEISTGKLSYVVGGHAHWQKSAVSGNVSGRLVPGNNGALPPGFYELPVPPEVQSKKEKMGAYCDPKGNCWSQVIIPQFSTSRDGLLIHPDGNVPGTQGCIGLTGEDTSGVEDFLKDWFKGKDAKPLALWVRL